MSILCVLLLCFRVLELNRCVCCCCCFFSYSFLSRWLLPSFCFCNFCLFRPRFGKIQLNWHRARTPFFSFFLRFVAAAVVTMCGGCRYCRWCRCRSLVFLFVRSSSSSFWSHLGVDFKRTHTHTHLVYKIRLQVKTGWSLITIARLNFVISRNTPNPKHFYCIPFGIVELLLCFARDAPSIICVVVYEISRVGSTVFSAVVELSQITK